MQLSSNRWLLRCFFSLGLGVLIIDTIADHEGWSARKGIEGLYTFVSPLCILIAVAERRRWGERLQTFLLGAGLLGISVLLYVILITLGVIQ